MHTTKKSAIIFTVFLTIINLFSILFPSVWTTQTAFAASAKPSKLVAKDFQPFVSLTPSQVIKKYGKTKNGEKTLAEVYKKQNSKSDFFLKYEGFSFSFVGGKFFELYATSNKIPGIRGITVGDSEKSVLSKFYSENKTINTRLKQTKPDIIGSLKEAAKNNPYQTSEYRLYFDNTGDVGIYYTGETPNEYTIQGMYYATSINMTITIKNGKVASYLIAFSGD